MASVQHGAGSDSELLALSREGDGDAFGLLWERHRLAGIVAARNIAPSLDPDDLVSGAYLKIFELVRDGRGPTGAFRPYLYRVISSIAADTFRSPEVTGLSMTEIPDLKEAGPWEDGAFDLNAAARAFESLPERWQSVLWYSEVEGLAPREIAPMLGLSPNGVSALASRAKEGLQSAWVETHIDMQLSDEACRSTREQLQRYQLGRLTAKRTREVRAHLDTCASCTAAAAEFKVLNKQIALVLATILIGGASAGALLQGLQPLAGAGALAAAGASSATGAASAASGSAGTMNGTAASAGIASSSVASAATTGGIGIGSVIAAVTAGATLVAAVVGGVVASNIFAPETPVSSAPEQPVSYENAEDQPSKDLGERGESRERGDKPSQDDRRDEVTRSSDLVASNPAMPTPPVTSPPPPTVEPPVDPDVDPPIVRTEILVGFECYIPDIEAGTFELVGHASTPGTVKISMSTTVGAIGVLAFAGPDGAWSSGQIPFLDGLIAGTSSGQAQLIAGADTSPQQSITATQCADSGLRLDPSLQFSNACFVDPANISLSGYLSEYGVIFARHVVGGAVTPVSDPRFDGVQDPTDTSVIWSGILTGSDVASPHFWWAPMSLTPYLGTPADYNAGNSGVLELRVQTPDGRSSPWMPLHWLVDCPL